MVTRTVILLLGVVCVLILGSVVWWRRSRREIRRRRLEDALKAILTAELESRVLAAPGLAGLLEVGYEATIRLIEQMQSSGLVYWGSAGLALTRTGREAAVRLLRAHRLTERFLVDEARMAVERVHREADRAEHAMTDAQLAELNELLGHPDWDPHGDPIPDARGGVAGLQRYLLDGWPSGRRAIVAHVEDEPPEALRRLWGMGLRLGALLEVTFRSEDVLTVRIGNAEVRLPAALARQVHVRPCDDDTFSGPSTRLNLAQLAIACPAHVVCLEEACRGFTRRRLLDLGITPGARIQAEMTNAGGSARAYRVRDTVIVLRREQAQQIIVEKIPVTPNAGMR